VCVGVVITALLLGVMGHNLLVCYFVWCVSDYYVDFECRGAVIPG